MSKIYGFLKECGSFFVLSIVLSVLFICLAFHSIFSSINTPSANKQAQPFAETTETTENSLSKPLSGIKWAAVGDSFTRGFGVADIGEKTYSDYIVDRTGVTCINLGEDNISYTGFYGRKILDRIDEVPSDVDVITICAGINDACANLGSIDDDISVDSFYGAFKRTVLEYIKRYPNAAIGIITPTHINEVENDTKRNADITIKSNAIKEVCALYAIPCLDLHSCDGLYSFNEDIRKIYFNDFEGIDTMHPNTKGHERVSKIIEPWLKTLV